MVSDAEIIGCLLKIFFIWKTKFSGWLADGDQPLTYCTSGSHTRGNTVTVPLNRSTIAENP